MSGSSGGSFGRVGMHVGADWAVRCDTYETTTPILTVNAGSSSVSFSIADRTTVPAEGVAFARELARQAEQFAADCERLNAGQHDQACSDGPAVDAA